MLSTIFIPHGHCYLWKTGLVLLHLSSDSIIAIAYFAIPIMLVYLVDKREDIPFDWIFFCFGAFIIFCGFTHLMEVWTLWHPNYWISGCLKACTAAISLSTALILFYLLPKLLAIPNVPKLEALNTALAKEIGERKKVEAKLQIQTEELEQALQKLQSTQSQMIQNEKMSSLGQMVAGVAHEINNPVSFIYGNITHANEYARDLIELVEVYGRHYSKPPEEIQNKITAIELDFLKQDFVNLLNSMKQGANRIREIVVSLRNFSRLDEAEFKQVDIHQGIDSTLMILENRLKVRAQNSTIQIIKEYSKIPLVECSPGQLNQVFLNILVNAIDALDEYNLQNHSNEIKNKPNIIQISTQKVSDDLVLIKIADNGPGISEEIRTKIFDPFFTTKKIGQGTGLGLSISHQIVVEKHNGKLSCESSYEQGTEFFIEIPISRKLEIESLDTVDLVSVKSNLNCDNLEKSK